MSQSEKMKSIETVMAVVLKGPARNVLCQFE